MRFFAFLLLPGCLILGTPGMIAQNIGPIDVPARSNNSVESLPPWDEAYPELRNRIASRFSKNEMAKIEALRQLKKYDGVEALIASEIEKDILSGEYNFNFWQNFEVLAKLRTVKALRILGPYLYDERIIRSPTYDMAHESPRACAGIALANMNLANAPSRNSGWGGMSDERINAWKIWWEENKNNLEAALNPPAEAQTPPPQAPGTELNLPPRPEAPSQEEEKAPSTPAASNLNVPALLLVILGTLLAALAAILMRRGRK